MNILNGKIYYLETLKKEFEEWILKINNNYQRKFVWPTKFQRALILSAFKDYPIGFLIIRSGLSSGEEEIVDGQQRTTTILKFIKNELNLNSTHGYDVIEILKVGMNLKNEKYFILK